MAHMDKLDWTRFKKRISINRDASDIFNAWTNQEELEKWFLSKAHFFGSGGVIKDRKAAIEKGDHYQWNWHGSTIDADGLILINNGKDHLAFSFFICEVSVRIQEEQGEQVVELEQTNIPLDEASRMDYYVECSRGWTFFLSNLKSILEGGIDLRNRNVHLKSMVNT